MTAEPVTWTIREQREGPITVWKGRQRMQVIDDEPNIERVIPRVLRQMGPHDVLEHQEADGYRYRLQGRRRRWRAGIR